MKLSIIIPVYNVESYIDECISSLYNQGLNSDEFEVLLIDDGSTDSSLTFVDRWAKNKNNIRVFRQENKGQASARNLGIDKARGKYIVFVDSDDYLLANKLSKLLQLAEDMRLDAIVYCMKVEKSLGDTFSLKIQGVKYEHIYQGTEVALNFFVFGSICRGMFSKAVFEKHNLRFRIGFTHEDSELCFRLYPLLQSIIFVDEDVYFYRYNEQSTDRSKSIELLKRNIESEAILVSKVLEDIQNRNYDELVEKKYRKISNSIMIGLFKRIRANKIWTKREFEDKLKWMRNIGIYPLVGRTNSFKSNMTLFFFNMERFLKLYLYVRR